MRGVACGIIIAVFYIGGVKSNCAINYGGCDKINGLCWENQLSPGNSYCSCKAGYKLDKAVKNKCIDVNECATWLHDCDTTNGRCVNTIGGYRCLCNCNYMLDYSKTKCLLITAVSGMCSKPSNPCPITTQPPTTRPLLTRAPSEKYYTRRWQRIWGWDQGRAQRDTKYNDEDVEEIFENAEEIILESQMLKLLSNINDEISEMKTHEANDDLKKDKETSKSDTFSFHPPPAAAFPGSSKRSGIFSLSNAGFAGPPSCTCEIGYRRNNCGLCEDINECLGVNNCTDVCHNTDGAYYCTCNAGRVLGPCGYKCYEPGRRPRHCLKHVDTNLLLNSRMAYTYGYSYSQLLNQFTTTACTKYGYVIAPHALSNHGNCTLQQRNQYRNETVSISLHGTVSVIVNSMCTAVTNGQIWVVKNVYNSRAHWKPWSCWRECKASCSGGVQIRTRECNHGEVGHGNCRGPATQKRPCYSGPKCDVPVRKSVQSLTLAEQLDLVQAMKKYKSDLYSVYGFHSAAGTHGWPYQCRGVNDGNNGGCCYHGARLNFLTWHRAEMKQFELGLTRHLRTKNLGMPYWDWLSSSTPPNMIWAKQYHNVENPFANMTIRIDLPSSVYIQRDQNFSTELADLAFQSYFRETYKMMKSKMIHDFSESLENSHNQIHVAACSREEGCDFSMANLAYASFDPLFLFHHSNVDRLFAVYQKELENNNEMAWTRQVALQPQDPVYQFNVEFDPFRNSTMSPWISLRSVNTMEDMYYYEELLYYKYDTVDMSAIAATSAAAALIQSSTQLGRDNFYVAQFQRSLQEDVLIRYYYADIHPQLSPFPGCRNASRQDQRFLGEQLILGTKLEKSWINRQATLTDVSNFFTSGGIDPRTTYPKIQACYLKNATCTQNCELSTAPRRYGLPSPHTLIIPRLTASKQLRIYWAKKNIYPNWDIDVKASTDFIQFVGPEAHNIVLYRTLDTYRRCDPNQHTKIACVNSVCVLPRGTYHFAHVDPIRCILGMKIRILSTF